METLPKVQDFGRKVMYAFWSYACLLEFWDISFLVAWQSKGAAVTENKRDDTAYWWHFDI